VSEQTTCSAIISFAEKLESNTSKFYEELAKKNNEGKEIFLAFSEQSRKNKVLITRTYQETITDALEACFIQINLSNYLAEPRSKDGMSHLDALEIAINLEEKAAKFYLDATEQSKSLLATIPRALKKVAENRKERVLKLKTLLSSITLSKK